MAKEDLGKDMGKNLDKAMKSVDGFTKKMKQAGIKGSELESIFTKYTQLLKEAQVPFDQMVKTSDILANTMGKMVDENGKLIQGYEKLGQSSKTFLGNHEQLNTASGELLAKLQQENQIIQSGGLSMDIKNKMAEKYGSLIDTAQASMEAEKDMLNDQVKAQRDLVKLQLAKNTGLRGSALSAAANYKILLDEGKLTQEQYDEKVKVLQENQSITQELQDQVQMEEEIAAAILENRDNTESWGKSLNKAYATSKAIANDPKAMGGLVLGQMVKAGKEMVGVFDEMKGEGMAAGQALDATMKSFSLKSMAGLSDTKGALKGLNEEFGTTQGFSAEVIDDIGSIAHEMGISGDEAGKLVGQMMKMNGESAKTAQATLEYTKELAVANGLNPGAVTKEMSQNMDKVHLFTKGGSKEFAKIATEAKKIGLELSTAAKMSESLLDFESSIEKQMEASVLLGKELNFDKARQLALQGDSLGAAKEMLAQVGGLEAFNSMNVVQQKALADSMGMSVEELNKQVNATKAQGEAMGEMTEEERIAAEERAKQLENIRAIASMTQKYGMFAMSIVQFVSQGHLKEAAHWVKEKAHMLWKMATGQKLAKAGSMLKKDGTPDMRFKANKLKAGGGGTDLAGKAGKDAGKATKAGGAASKGGGVAKGLKELAKGVAAFAKGKVIMGALIGLPATAIGLVAMVAGVPAMLALAAIGIPAGAGLIGLSKGVKKMGDGKVLMGAVGLGAVALSLVALGAAAMLFAAGGAAGTLLMVVALYALVGAIALMGMLSGSGIGWLGVALVLAIGVALLLMGAAVYLAASGMAILVEAFTGLFSVISMENILPIFMLGPALIVAGAGMMVFAASLVVLGVAALIAAPGLMFLALSLMLLGASLLVVGVGLLLLGEGLEPFQNFLGFFAEMGMSVAAALMMTAVGFFVFAGALLVLAFAAFFGTPALIGLGFAMLMLGLGVKFAAEGLVAIAEVLPEIAEGAMGLGLAATFIGLMSAALMGLGLAGLFSFPGLVLASLGLGMLALTMGLFATAVTAAMPGVALLIQLGAMGEMFAMIAESMWHMAAGIAAFATAGLLTLPTIMGLIALAFVAPILTLLGDSINYDLQNNAPPPVSADDVKMDMVIAELQQIRMAFQTPGVINMDGQKVGDVIGLAVSNSGIQ